MKNIPNSKDHDILRGALMDHYMGSLSSNLAYHDQTGIFLRNRKEFRGSARGFLASTVLAMLRKRVMTLYLLAVAENRKDQFTAFEFDVFPETPYSFEAVAAFLRWLHVDMDVSDEETLEVLEKALPWVKTFSAPDLGDCRQFLSVLKDKPWQGTPESAAIECSALPVMIARWTQQFGHQDALNLARAMQQTAALQIRLTGNAPPLNDFLRQLKDQEIPARALPHAPRSVELERKSSLKQMGLRDKDYEIQDLGSQYVSLALNPLDGEKILDACAGAGGKTLHLLDLAFGAKVDVHDIEPARLERLKPRLQELELETNRVTPVNTADLPYRGPYHAVLIDAPCTGMGRLRRDPATLWRKPFRRLLEEATTQQQQCLVEYGDLVKPGGRLVYATCSLEAEETLKQIELFLERHVDFHWSPLPPLFYQDEFRKTGDPEKGYIYLLPSIHGTDGFFIARLARKEKGLPPEEREAALSVEDSEEALEDGFDAFER